MPGSDYFKGAAQTGISGTPTFSSTEGNSTQHITHTHTNNYYNSNVHLYYSGPPPSIAQPRSPVDDDVNGSEQRQTTTTTRSPPNDQAPFNGVSREEERVERLGGALDHNGNSPADGNGSEMPVQETLFARIRAFFCAHGRV